MISLLAIETSTEACSVALRTANGDISRYAEEPRSHTQLLMPMIKSVLSEAAISVTELNALSVTIGPGSFTGLRIGFGVTQGLAYGLDIPVVPVSTLELMVATHWRQSLEHYRSNGIAQSAKIVPVIDARMNQFNCGYYELDTQGHIVNKLSDRLLGSVEAIHWIEALSPDIIIGDGQGLFSLVKTNQTPKTQIYPHALDLLNIAQRDIERGAAKAIDSVELTYLRGADAWQKRKRIKDQKRD
jgi:tRNA threonylcarbamoyladenosine biosynthesis protein TsaB